MKSDSGSPRRKVIIVLLVLMAAKLALQLLLNSRAGLHRDEYLYLAFADHMDWGYVSVSPMIGALSWIVKNVFTDSSFWVRFFPVLASLATMGLMGWMVLELGGGTVAVLLSGLAFMFSVAYLRTGGLFQPVPFDVLFWTVLDFLFFKWMKTREAKWWALIFPMAGFAFLNKYMIAPLVLSLVLAALMTKDRKQVFSRHGLAGIGIALVIILPNVIWQFSHHLPVLEHMAALNATQLVNVNRLGFLIDQLLMSPSGVWVWIAGLAALLVSPRWKQFRPFGWACLIVFGIMMAMRGKSYYTLGLYPALFAYGAVALERMAGWKGRVFRVTAVVFAVVLALPLIPFAMPVLSPPAMAKYAKSIGSPGLTWEDGKVHPIPQDFADMMGWDEVGRKVRDVWMALDETVRKDAVIYADNYGQAGSIRLYGRRDGVPEAVSFCDNYVLWAPDSLRLKTLIAVYEDTLHFGSYFRRAERLAVFDNPYFRECGSSVWVYSEPEPKLFREYKEWVRRRRGE
ncbi:glycosyltransferase family 39 protein [bacterium]|nr:glycosyltransferase family 39 protein [bacterium]